MKGFPGASVYASTKAALRSLTRGLADELATAAHFLASSDSSYVTGTELVVDGGFSQV